MCPYSSLAVAVIKRAIKDAIGADKKLREDALEFLATPNASLEFWCLLANIEYGMLLEEFKTIRMHRPKWKKILCELESIENARV